jgi:hypothetical protein
MPAQWTGRPARARVVRMPSSTPHRMISPMTMAVSQGVLVDRWPVWPTSRTRIEYPSRRQA